MATTTTKTLQHTWVRHSVQRVHIIEDPISGEPITLPVGVEDVVFGCDECSAPMTPEEVKLPCGGTDAALTD